jgi:hypothetical protein
MARLTGSRRRSRPIATRVRVIRVSQELYGANSVSSRVRTMLCAPPRLMRSCVVRGFWRFTLTCVVSKRGRLNVPPPPTPRAIASDELAQPLASVPRSRLGPHFREAPASHAPSDDIRGIPRSEDFFDAKTRFKSLSDNGLHPSRLHAFMRRKRSFGQKPYMRGKRMRAGLPRPRAPGSDDSARASPFPASRTGSPDPSILGRTDGPGGPSYN